MDVLRFKALADGETPSVEDYAAFVALAEKLPIDLLWDLLRLSPKMNWLLRAVVSKNLQEKIPRANVDHALNQIATELTNWNKGVNWEERSALMKTAPVSMKKSDL
ncbi:MAG TPA: hypothetical protein VMU24_13035 [Candidatus Acidoferrales bacterium]|nr:hypothetical protein [Candidatus Acidoferrales bacterium]